MASSGSQAMSPNVTQDSQQLQVIHPGEQRPYGPVSQVGVFHMDRQLTPRQAGAEEMVTREWFAGSEANNPFQTFDMMTSAYQTSVLAQRSTLETQTQKIKFLRGQQMQDLDRYLRSVRTQLPVTP